MKAIAIKLLTFAFLASTFVSASADDENNVGNEETPASSKIHIAVKNGAAEKSETANGSESTVGEASAINRGTQIESGTTAAPIDVKTYDDGQLLSE